MSLPHSALSLKVCSHFTPFLHSQIIGDLIEAEDAVQESWLHLSRSDTSGVENLGD